MDDYATVSKLCVEHVKPWLALSPEAVTVKQIGGGLSNKLFIASAQSERVLVRLFGDSTGDLIDRQTDNLIFTVLSERNYGPRLLSLFPSGRIEAFVENERSLVPLDVVKPEFASRIAERVAQLHGHEMPISKRPVVLSRLAQWSTDAAAASFSDPVKAKLFFDFMAMRPVETTEAVSQLIKERPSPIVFCHNDLTPGNFLLKPGGDICVIDYEYAGYNPLAYDIANHFTECAYDLNTPEPPNYIARPEQYPTVAQRRHFLEAYVRARKEIDSSVQLNVDELLRDCNVYGRAACLLWAFWSVAQAKSSTLPFGFLEYGIARLEHARRLEEEYPTLTA